MDGLCAGLRGQLFDEPDGCGIQPAHGGKIQRQGAAGATQATERLAHQRCRAAFDIGPNGIR